MQQYIGTKLVLGQPMTRQEYCNYQGWKLPDNEAGRGDDPGCLVEYLDGGEPNHPGHKGYISWSPAEQFKGAYRESTGMPFGLAIEAMRKGLKVARAGWNGRGMFLQLQVPGELSKMTFPYPFFTIPDCEEGTRRIPYAPTIVDIMSDDWSIVEG